MRYERVDYILSAEPVFEPYTKVKAVIVANRYKTRQKKFSVLTQLVTVSLCSSSVDAHSCPKTWVLATAADLVKAGKLDLNLAAVKLNYLNRSIAELCEERDAKMADYEARLKELMAEKDACNTVYNTE